MAPFSSVLSVVGFLTTCSAASFLPKLLRQAENGGAAPVQANAGPAYGPPTTPTKTFSDGGPFRIGDPPQTPLRTTDHPSVEKTQDPVYEVRDLDLPFLRNFKGNAKFYKHLNDLTSGSSTWDAEHDSENQTALGIPTNAYWLSGVTIHPYFLEYADVDRKSDLPNTVVSLSQVSS